MGEKQSKTAAMNLHRCIMGGLLLLIVGIGPWLSYEARIHKDRNIRRELLRQTSSVAATLSMGDLRELTFRAEDAGQPAFQRITRQLRAYAHSADIRSLYTMAERDGRIFFGPESLLPDDPYATPPGTLHQVPSSYDFEAFRTAEPVVYGPASDEFGEFVTAIVPVVDPLSGKVLMAVGLDLEASVWRAQVHKAQWVPLLAILSPLALLLLGYFVYRIQKRSPNLRIGRLHKIQIATYFSVMLLLTVIAFLSVRSVEQSIQHSLFSTEAGTKAQYYDDVFNQIDFVLHTLTGFFEASEHITREEFSAFCQPIFEKTPIQTCLWLPALSGTSAPAFTARMQTAGIPDFSIRRFADDDRPGRDPADPVYPAVYVEPASQLPTLLGYDFYSHPAIRRALVEAVQSNSGNACLVPAPTTNTNEPAGLFFFVPVSHAQQRGLIGITIHVPAMVERSNATTQIPELSATLFELQNGKRPSPVYCSVCTAGTHCIPMLNAELKATVPIFAFGKTYMMLFTAQPQWFSAHPQHAAELTLAIGLLLSLLLTYLAGILLNRPLLLEKKVEQRTRELAESKERFDIAIAAAKMGVWEYEIANDRLIWNDRMLEIYGAQEVLFDGGSQKWLEYIHPDDLNHFIQEFTTAEQTGKDFNIEVHIVRPDGEIRYVSTFGKVIRDKSGKAERIIGVNLDITDELEQKRKFQILFENMDSGAAIYEALDDGQDFVFLDINAYGLRNGHRQREDVIGKRVTEVFPDVKDMGLFEVMQRVWRTGIAEDLPVAHYKDDRNDLWLENHVLKLPTGQMVCLYNDITERKRSQQALEESRQLLCNIIDSLPERVWWKDLDSRYLGCNIHVAQDAGFDHPDQIIGKTDFDMCWAVHAEAFQADDREVIESGVPRLFDPELQVLEDGSTRWIEVSMIPLKDTTGKIFGVLGTYADITDRMQIEEQLRASENQFRSAITDLQVGVVVHAADSSILFCNPQACLLLGLDEEQLAGEKATDPAWCFVHEDLSTMTIQEYPVSRAIATHEKIINQVIGIQRPDQKEITWVLASAVPAFTDKNELSRIIVNFMDITESRRAQNLIKRSEARLLRAQQVAQVGNWEFDLENNLVTASDEAKRIYGLEERLWTISEMQNIPLEECRGMLDKALKALINQGSPYDIEFTIRRPSDGALREIHSVAEYDPGKKHVFGVIQDITERKRAELALQELDIIQGTILDNSTLGIALIENRKFKWVNPRLSELFGRERHELQGADTRILYSSAEEYLRTGAMAYEALGQNLRFDHTLQFSRADGELFWCRLVGKALDPARPLEAGSIWMFEDITERKQSELSLARSEAKYRDLFEQSADACLIIKQDHFVDCNQAAVDMLRCEDKNQLLNMRPAEFSPDRQPDGRLSQEKADEIMQRMKEEKAVRFEWLHKRADGEIFPVEVSLTSITDSEGSHIIHTTWRDIAERKRTEDHLVRLSTAIEQSPESIVITDPHGNIQYVNPAFEKITGYAADEALGQNPRMLKSGEQPPSFYEEMWRTLSSGKNWEGQVVNKRKDGSLYTEEASITPVTDAEDCIVNYVAVKRDISQEIVKEEELRHAHKMDAVGQLAGGVAHDFNNILQGIIGFSELLRYSLDESSVEYDNANEIHKAANRAAKLTQQLLTFSRKQPMRLEETDLNNVVYDTEALLHVLLGNKHEVVLDLADELPPAYADQSQLTQIIMNLAVNARDAMPDGGRMSISTECILITDADAAHIAGASPGTYLCLALTDTGTGMDAETMSRVFDPFFTTKDLGTGTGLGLAVIYGIVKQNKGWINIYSEIGKGSCFKVYLPVAGSAGASAPAADPADERPDRSARILLIDDDPKILNLVRKVLGEAELTIIAAASAEEGLVLFDRHAADFDLLMSDMELPGMRGDQLAEALRKKNPELPVLLFSGYRDQVNRWKNIAEKGYVFLNKPFTVTLLLDTVRNILKDSKGTHG